MTYSPKAITAAYPLLEARFKSARRSGVAADKAGYHNSRNRLKNVPKWRNDYSISEGLDKLGDGNAASALDVGLNTPELNTACRRLMAASLARDPRLTKVVREWFGSYTGRSVIGYSLFRKRPASSDSSHEWHLHISGWRKYADDEQAWLGVVEVILGHDSGTLTSVPLDTVPTVPGPPKPQVSLAALVAAAKADPDREQGGTTPGAEDDVRLVEAALVARGLLLAQYGNDGAYGTATVEAYRAFQESIGYDGDDADGIPGEASLTKLGGVYGFEVTA
jgi:hypothetical protein